MTPRRWVVLVAIVIASCSAPTYRPDVPLTDQVFQSSDGLLRGRVPQGWFVSGETDLAPHLAAWLVREDFGAAMAFEEIRLDETTSEQVEREGLELLGELSLHLRQAQDPLGKVTVKPTEFSLNGRQFCRYEYASQKQDGNVTVVVFQNGGKFFESAIVPLKTTPTQNYQELREVQQAVLSTLQ